MQDINRAYRSVWPAMCLSLAGCVRVQTAVHTEQADTSAVVFDVPVPAAPEELPTYQLHATSISPALLQQLGWQGPCKSLVAPNPNPEPTPTPKPNPIRGDSRNAQIERATTGDSQPTSDRCRVDQDSGDVELYPDYEALLRPTDAPWARPRALQHAKSVMFSQEVLPQDETVKDLDEGLVVRHQRAFRDGTTGPTSPPSAAIPLLYVYLKRSVAGYGVDGPGSRMALMLNRDNAVVGYLRSWRQADNRQTVKAQRTAAEVRAEIQRQLLAAHPQTSLHVRKIELAYYDGSGQLLQPVYRYVVEMLPSSKTIGRAEHLVGYVRYADTSEPVPSFGDKDITKLLNQHLIEREKQLPPMAAATRVGVYIERDDSEDWRHDGLDFLSSLRGSDTGARYAIGQVEASFPYQFTTRAARYVNSVQLALVEGHGAAWRFATRSDCCDPVFLGVPNTRPEAVLLGAGVPNGQLKYLALHSCNVVASPDDKANWATPWWNVFQGLTSVVGYRTSMYINDGAGAVFGHSLAAGAPVIAAWFHAVASVNPYVLDPKLSFRCQGEQAMGRPAAISVCGQANATVESSTTPAAPATCLDAWWISDSTGLESDQQ